MPTSFNRVVASDFRGMPGAWHKQRVRLRSRPPVLGAGLLVLALISGPSIAARTANSAPASHPKPAPAVHLPAAIDVYNRSLVADKVTSYQGHQVTTYWGKGVVRRVFIQHLAPNLRRIEYLAPDTFRGRVLISDGNQEWTFYPGRKELHHRLLSGVPVSQQDIPLKYEQLRSNYDLSFLPTTQLVADRKAFVLSFHRTRGGSLARRMWIDASTGLELKRESYTEAGVLGVTMAFTDIDMHPKLTAAMFREPGGPGSPVAASRVTKVEAKAEREVTLSLTAARQQLDHQAFVPDKIRGFKLTSASLVTSPTNKPVLHLRYSDGLVLISVFELPRVHPQAPTRVPPAMRPANIGGVQGHYTHHASLTTLNWDMRAVNLTMMGEIAAPKLIELAHEFMTAPN